MGVHCTGQPTSTRRQSFECCKLNILYWTSIYRSFGNRKNQDGRASIPKFVTMPLADGKCLVLASSTKCRPRAQPQPLQQYSITNLSAAVPMPRSRTILCEKVSFNAERMFFRHLMPDAEWRTLRNTYCHVHLWCLSFLKVICHLLLWNWFVNSRACAICDACFLGLIVLSRATCFIFGYATSYIRNTAKHSKNSLLCAIKFHSSADQ